MNRDAVFELIRDHLADELDIDPARVTRAAASRRTWKRTRSTCTRWCRSSRTPTGSP